jgi:5-methylcytosine-specific restriction endonuclease McrA
MEHTHILASLSDELLLRRLLELLGQSRRVEAELVAHIGEVDVRRLYAREAAPSMFAYCTEVLHLSEAEAYLRITVARAAREHPILLEMLADGRLHLSAIAKLARHLNVENVDAVTARASHRSKREIEELVAELAPRPDAPTLVRKLPEPVQLRPDGVATEVLGSAQAPVPPVVPVPDPLAIAAAPPSRPGSMEVLSPARFKVQFTASAELCRKIERLKALMRSSIPDGDLAVLIEDAVTEKLARLEARRFAQTGTPRKSLGSKRTAARSRYIPAAVRRAVYARDGGRCRYADEQGTRCTARDRLEFHHRHPFGHGGEHDPGNLALMCRTHNGYLAEIDYGKEHLQRRQRERDRVSERREAYGL